MRLAWNVRNEENPRPPGAHLIAMTEPETDTFEDSQASQRSELMPVHPYLFVVLECDRPTSGGARFALGGVDEVIIGRGLERASSFETHGGVRRLVVRIPGRSMSSTHARLLRAEDGWILEDARSTNGSFVNGARVERTSLQDCDVIELGHTIFCLHRALPTPPGTALAFDWSQTSRGEPAFDTLFPGLANDLATLARLALSKLSILLLGETGTGKELVARAIHAISGRTGPFVAINCGAIAPNLVESQLFGYVRGAFSGAVRDEPGIVRAAERGTLLLDEIGDLPLAAQPALLRVLQEREVMAVGGVRPTRVDVRVLAATHKPLERLMGEDRFRRDLFARLDGYRFRLPNLIDRRADLGIMVAHILGAGGTPSTVGLTPEAGVALVLHDWPFNVRELVQRIGRALVLAEGTPITPAHLDLSAKPRISTSPASVDSPPGALSAADLVLQRELLAKLEEHGGNIAEVSRAMGKARMQIHRWMKRFGIDGASFRRTK